MLFDQIASLGITTPDEREALLALLHLWAAAHPVARSATPPQPLSAGLTLQPRCWSLR
jgi:hypothetical protein